MYILWGVQKLCTVFVLLTPRLCVAACLQKNYTHRWEDFIIRCVTSMQLQGELGKVRWRTVPWTKQLLAILLGSSRHIFICLYLLTPQGQMRRVAGNIVNPNPSLIFWALVIALKNENYSQSTWNNHFAEFTHWNGQCMVCDNDAVKWFWMEKCCQGKRYKRKNRCQW